MYPFSHSPCSLNRTLGHKFVGGRLLRTGSSHNNDVLVFLRVTPQRWIAEGIQVELFCARENAHYAISGIEVELFYTTQCTAGCTPGCILPLSESLERTQ